MDNFLRISGMIRTSMFLNIFMSVLSAVLEYLFLGVFGFGIWGAALATCSGMIVCALIALVPFLRGKAILKFCRPRFSAAMIRQIIACGSPNFLNNIAGRITSILLNFILVRLGRGNRRIRIRHTHVCGRLYPAAALRHVRFPSACRRLQLGCRQAFPCAGNRKMLFCSQCCDLTAVRRGHPLISRPRSHGCLWAMPVKSSL